jgi:hypothetical protein
MLRTLRRRATAAAAIWLGGLLALGAPVTQAPADPSSPRATASRAFHGAIDADLRSTSGRLVGHLHGHVDGSGRGMGMFRPANGRGLQAEIVALRARATGAARASLRGRGRGLRLAARIDRGAELEGGARLRGQRLRVSGAARERLPRLRRGMRMLVVGHPRGQGYRTLKRYFRPVRYRRGAHTRRQLLRARGAFHSFGALAFGPDVRPGQLRAHGLLRSFYGAGKWVIAAPASRAAHRALGAVHPHTHRRAAPAVAVRSLGAEGDHHAVTPTLVYPRAATGSRGAAGGRTSARRRAEWYVSQLRRFSKPHMRTARRATAAQRAQASGVDFALPYNAAAIEIVVPYYHEFTMTGAQNVARYKPCGWNTTTWNAWCADTYFYRDQYPTKSRACHGFLDRGYRIIDEDTVHSVTNTKNGDGAYTVEFPHFRTAFVQDWQQWGDWCPEVGSQTGNIQGNDYYYAIFDKTTLSHTLVVLSDPTISAAIDSQLFRNNFKNGSGHILVYGQPGYSVNKFDLTETAWFLGAYTHSLTLSGGPQVTDTSFEYSGTKSFPQNQISFSGQSTGVSTSQSFNIGIFDTSFTGGYGESVSKSAGVSINVPSWDVSPAPGHRTVTYNWTTNDPVSWATITGGAGGPFAVNKLSVADFSPSTLSVWSGRQTWGKISLANQRILHLVDHWSRYNGNGAIEDGFAVTDVGYGDNPDDVTPVTENPAGPGINLCDPKVRAPDFVNACTGG